MSQDNKILESLIAGGIIGAALGSLLSDKKDKESTLLGAVAGAVILATYKANEEARRTNVSFFVEENGKLYEVQQGGTKKFIRNIPKPDVAVPKHFKLK
jgi:glycine zipper 2TM protein